MSAKQKLNLLSNLKSITFKFYPDGLTNKSLRSCLPLATAARVRALSPDCKVQIVSEENECEPEIKLKYYNGFEQSIFTKNLDQAAIVESIEMKKKSLKVEEVKKQKTPDTSLEEILTPVTKKKDTGAKAGLKK
ncbi:ribosomal protein L53 [Heterostelium album PN500]|uniref:Ribosomal protein L53 n=1 Tax=Heterostelium pallidum (strain ATCC 26659 / Pp 5 / PN500) TaxID=670386 RepID=D3B173_HETP5|nr:ribosomal protein L53 [Heterostelium album PN500]EFA85047.1 ribosomal protein L53 [Heterostelium album PN500]|eukprot:XP_020437157.1 ribosomal protein L53 [Heterostelium album PN500]